MKNKDSRIIVENYQYELLYKKSKSNLNITFNRISFIFFICFIICLIYSIHLIHLGSRKVKTESINDLKQVSNKLYRADIVDINSNYLAKTVNSIDIGLKTSDVINQKKLLLSLNLISPDKKQVA